MCSGDMDDDGRASPLILAAKLGLLCAFLLVYFNFYGRM